MKIQRDKKIKILYICGYGRSGSTLLDRILGNIEGFFSVGELRHIWERNFVENQLCGCNKPFKECNFWKDIIKIISKELEQINIDEILSLKYSTDRIRYIPQLILPYQTSRYKKDFQRYAQILSRLYHAIKEISGCRVIIDSSKEPSYSFVLNNIEELEVYPIHLVRDSRAVVYSWYKRKKFRPEIHWKIEYMREQHPIYSAIEWLLHNGLNGLLKYKNSRYMFIKYEKLVQSPYAIVCEILRHIGEDYSLADKIFVDESTVELNLNHTVSGNPIRFKGGLMKIQPDTEWETQLDKIYKYLVTFITFPFLFRYGYIIKFWGG